MHGVGGGSPGLTISAKFRRNFGNFFVSASYRDSKFRYFSVYFVFKFKIQQISSEILRNSPKFTEIPERNSVSAQQRDFTGKRNGEPFLRSGSVDCGGGRSPRWGMGVSFPVFPVTTPTQINPTNRAIRLASCPQG